VITEFRMFEILDKLQNTPTGLDVLPAWFLRLGAPVFCGPLARLFNKSVATSTIPKQWKMATITPVPKIATPREHVDFRPISVTSVLSRALERVIVRQFTEFIYPALLEPPAQLNYTDASNRIYDRSCRRYSPICHRTTFVQSVRGGHCS